MGLLSIFKKRIPVPITYKGRYETYYFIRQLLGESLNAIELQIALNKDLSERNEIIQMLEKLEEYMRSDIFTTRFDVHSADKDIEQISNKGYDTCVLQNDRELEIRCLKIMNDIAQYATKLGLSEGTLTEEEAKKIDDILDLRATAGFLRYFDLGGVLKTADEQMVWMFISSLTSPQKVLGRFNSGNLIAQSLATLSSKDVLEMANNMRVLKNKLLAQKKISESDFDELDVMINEGLEKNLEVHRRNPDRT